MFRHVRTLRNLLRRHGRSRTEADDLIQEAFLRLHTYCNTGQVQQPEAFLRRTVLNLSVDMHRKERRDLYADQPVEALRLTHSTPGPDEELELQQRLNNAEAALNELSPRTREIFLMHRVEGYGCSEIASRFGISVSAVEKHIARAVLALMDVVRNAD
jgi:RNA polymerase sigma factor (sigma-70 family)